MKTRDFLVIFWIAAFLMVGEAALEVRAHFRGWDVPIFAKPADSAQAVEPASNAEPPFGPTPRFPFRSQVVPETRDPDVTRIWVASASYGEDRRVPANEIFPNRLAAILKHAGMRVQMLNASKSGSEITDDIKTLRRLAEAWKPDLVILYEMSNDINVLSKQLHPEMPSRRKLFDPGIHRTAFHSWPDRLVESTTLYALLKEHVMSRVAQQRVLADTLGPDGEEGFAQRVRAFLSACRDIGAKPILVTFATGYERKDLGHIPANIRNAVFRYNQHLSMTGWMGTIESYNRVIREVASESGVTLIDLDNTVGGNPEYFRDFVHFTPNGHQQVAQVLADAVLHMREMPRIADNRNLGETR